MASILYRMFQIVCDENGGERVISYNQHYRFLHFCNTKLKKPNLCI